MQEAYAFCNIPPDQFLNYTPAELEMMVDTRKIQYGVKEAPRIEMDNPEMEAVARTIADVMKHKPDRGVR